MHTDILLLREFYASMRGRVCRDILCQHIRRLWPDVKGRVLAGLGYTFPCLSLFRGEADRILALSPATQGVMAWPGDGPGLVALCAEDELPLPDMSVDRLLVMHCLETTRDLHLTLREAWRVLNGTGKLLLVVPNRRGVWARVDSTPFGHGNPWSASQIKRALREAMFVPERAETALFMPPFRSGLMLKIAPLWERIGARWFRTFGGVHIIEASKQLYAPTARITERYSRRPALIPAAPSPARFTGA